LNFNRRYATTENKTSIHPWAEAARLPSIAATRQKSVDRLNPTHIARHTRFRAESRTPDILPGTISLDDVRAGLGRT
jgi:hypothetical protein